VNALSTLTGDAEEGGSPLQWWPAYAGIARSGDLGFTTGPFSIRGQGYVGNYFTVWRRQPDGEWRWIFDGGVDVIDDAPPAEDAHVERLPVAPGDGESQAAALRAVEELDAALATEAAEDAPASIARRLSPDGRVNRAFLPRSVGLDAARETLAGHAGAIRFEPLGGAASRAGDLAFTYGNARWSAEGAAGIGYYARIWQLRPEGWQLVFDQIVPHRGPPPES
jgi:ketosteroid isomerase-like protein